MSDLSDLARAVKVKNGTFRAKETQFFSKIFGTTQGDRQRHISRLTPGQRLLLVREPRNPVDQNAIMVCVSTGWIFRRTVCLGYLSADLAEQYADHVDAGGTMLAMVTQVTGGGRGQFLGCNINVVVTS